MNVELGRVRELVRYPVKSMAGVATESAMLGWYGLAGDRRFAFRRIGDESGFPWLTASRVPELILYRPTGLDDRSGEPLPSALHRNSTTRHAPPCFPQKEGSADPSTLHSCAALWDDLLIALRAVVPGDLASRACDRRRWTASNSRGRRDSVRPLQRCGTGRSFSSRK